ncbi:hypothetical protein BDZ45DRAFT_793975 [Acephala macrosclerotiorum]|nr:hypothetical protein BDZ45DRAFT_793975 [Acephala macrosclerotiorum]
MSSDPPTRRYRRVLDLNWRITPMDRRPSKIPSPFSDLEAATQNQTNNDVRDKKDSEVVIAGVNLIAMQYAHTKPWMSIVLYGAAQALIDIEGIKADLSEREGFKLENGKEEGKMLSQAKKRFVEGVVEGLGNFERDGDVNAFVVWAEKLMQGIGELLVRGEGIT